MALAIDASTPAKVTGTTASLTTASFTPPSGAALVLLFGTNNTSNGADTSISSVTNTGTTATWTREARKNPNAASTGGAGQPGGAEIWTASAPGGAITVTVNGVGSGTGFEKMVKIFVLTGADTTSLSNVAAASSASGLPSVSLTCSAGSYAFSVSSDWAQKGLGTAGTGQTITDEYNVAGQITIHAWRTTNTLSTAGSQTMNLTAPSAEQFNQVAIEVPASSGGATNVTLTDTGSGADAISVTATESLADTGTGTDALSTSATVSLADTATGTDAISVSYSIPLADTGSGADAFSVTSVSVPLADTGRGSDSLTASATASVADTGTGADALAVSVPVSPADTLHGTDAFSVNATVPLAETGSGTDALTVNVTVSLSDTATGTDAMSVNTGTPKSVSDTGSGTDAFSVTASVPLADTGSGVDSLAVSATASMADTATADDELSVVRLVSLSDTITATDAISVVNQGIVTNSGYGAINLLFTLVAYDDSILDSYAYFYKPPTWRNVGMVMGSLRFGIPTSVAVYRINGVWYQQQEAGVDNPVIANVDVDANTGLRLFFTKPMVVPGTLREELPIEPADPSWTPGSLTLL